MHLPFAKVIAFTQKRPEELPKALFDFFGPEPAQEDKQEIAFALFNEWLIFDYRQKNGLTFLAEYCLKDPDRLPKNILHQITEAAKTAIYSQFATRSYLKGKWVELENLASGEIIRVYDHTMTNHTVQQGTIHARVATIDDEWYFVGSNPLFFSWSQTERLKKFMRQTFKNVNFTPRDTWEIVKNQGNNHPKQSMPTGKELKNIHKKLAKKFESLRNRYDCTLTFEEITKSIYEENRNIKPIDFWQAMIKRGLTEKFFFDQLKLFENVWNYFPHHCLGDKSPAEVYEQYSKK